jgi:hypothetical protein
MCERQIWLTFGLLLNILKRSMREREVKKGFFEFVWINPGKPVVKNGGTKRPQFDLSPDLTRVSL